MKNETKPKSPAATVKPKISKKQSYAERVQKRVQGMHRVIEENPMGVRLVHIELPEAYQLSLMVDELSSGLSDMKLSMGQKISFDEAIEKIQYIDSSIKNLEKALQYMNESGFGTRDSIAKSKDDKKYLDKKLYSLLNSEDAELIKIAEDYQLTLENRASTKKDMLQKRLEEDNQFATTSKDEDNAFNESVATLRKKLEDENRAKKAKEKEERAAKHQQKLKDDAKAKAKRLAEAKKKSERITVKEKDTTSTDSNPEDTTVSSNDGLKKVS